MFRKTRAGGGNRVCWVLGEVGPAYLKGAHVEDDGHEFKASIKFLFGLWFDHCLSLHSRLYALRTIATFPHLHLTIPPNNFSPS
jgi:hypothetical protein